MFVILEVLRKRIITFEKKGVYTSDKFILHLHDIRGYLLLFEVFFSK